MADDDTPIVTRERRACFIASLRMDKLCVMFTQREAQELAALLEQHAAYERWVYSTATGVHCPAALPCDPKVIFPGTIRRVK